MYRTRSGSSNQRPTRHIAPRSDDGEDEADTTYPPIYPTDLPIDIVLSRLFGVRGHDTQYVACCPAHADTRPSLSVTEAADRTLLIYCHAGCAAEAIMEAIGLDMSYLFASSFALMHGRRRGWVARTRPYDGAAGAGDEPFIDHERFSRLWKLGRKNVKHALGSLARQLGLPVDSLDAIGVGYRDGRWLIPERDDQLRIVGIVYRDADGSKTCEKGSLRGLTIPHDWLEHPDPIYLPEGATDTAALHSVGASAIGRPAAMTPRLPRRWLGRLLRRHIDREIIVVGDRDPVRAGRSAGSFGAKLLTQYLGGLYGRRPVPWALPARPYNDVREQVVAGDWSRGLVQEER